MFQSYQKAFNDLTPNELYKILQLRSKVFVVEHKCIYEDLDNRDQEAVHIFYTDNQNNIIAYGRVVPKTASEFPAASLGRICVAAEYRKNKLGAAAVKDAINYIYQQFNEERIIIGALEYVVPFYQKFGFKAISKAYISEKGTTRIDMELIKSQSS